MKGVNFKVGFSFDTQFSMKVHKELIWLQVLENLSLMTRNKIKNLLVINMGSTLTRVKIFSDEYFATLGYLV